MISQLPKLDVNPVNTVKCCGHELGVSGLGGSFSYHYWYAIRSGPPPPVRVEVTVFSLPLCDKER